MSDRATTEPRVRVRVSHAHTQRGGWQHETTVELEWSERDELMVGRLRELLMAADRLGRDESARRSALDAGEGGAA